MGYNSFEFAGDVTRSLYGNLNTLSSSNQVLDLWAKVTATLTKAWQTGDPALRKKIEDLGKASDPQKAITNFLNTYLNSGHLDSFGMADIAALLNQLSQHWDSSSGSASSVQMSEIQQFGNLVSARSQIETSTGNTQVKAESSFLQQTTSAPQPISDAGNSAIGILGTISSILMQSFL